MTRIYHLARRADWAAARTAGVYRGGAADRADGFIHFSTAAQLVESAARHCAGATDLLVVAVEADTLGAALCWEDGRDGESFPHLHGSLDPASVLWVRPAPLGPDGRHDLPRLSRR